MKKLVLIIILVIVSISLFLSLVLSKPVKKEVNVKKNFIEEAKCLPYYKNNNIKRYQEIGRASCRERV